MIVEFHQIERTIEVQTAIGVDGISIRNTVLILRTLVPGIGGIVRSIGIDPVEDGNQIERQLVGSRKGLIIIQWCSPVLDAGPNRIFPGMVLVSIKVLIDWGIRFLYLRMSGTLEVHVQVLGQVPAHRELTVPEELFAERQRQL